MPTPTRTPPTSELARVLREAELTGQLAPGTWPALRELLLALSEAHALSDRAQLDALLTSAVGPLQQLVAMRAALTQARQALSAGYAALEQAGDDPAALAEAAQQFAVLADDLAARAQHLAELFVP
jgi:hypothetical protein